MIVFDIEIKLAIPEHGVPPVPGIEYCGGWRDYARMGVACICTYDLDSHLPRVFLEKQFPDFEAYVAEQGGATAGFNTRRFDMALLAANGIQLAQDTHYDALEIIWRHIGLDPDQFAPHTHGGWGLDAIMLATFSLRKSGSGAQAPIWWQTGERGKVVDYCLRDVWLEAMLITHMKRGRPIKAAGKPTITIPVPHTGVPT